MRQPDWDIDLEKGAQAELWVLDLRKAFAGKAQIEVKAPEPFLREQTFFAEYECCGRDGQHHRPGERGGGASRS